MSWLTAALLAFSQPALRDAPLCCGAPRACAAMSSSLISLSEVHQAAHGLGCTLEVKAIGPAYKVELWWREPPGGEAAELVGVSDGFSQPTGVVHLESIQVRRFTGYYDLSRSSRKRYKSLMRAEEGGLGILLSVAVGCWIRERCPFGCKRAQLLAIKDEPKQHATLVRYYRRLGFKPLREVENGPLKDALDLIAWGGEGTLMELTVDDFVAKWGPLVRRMGRHKQDQMAVS
ncbi:MAG: hypothetical protein SGPRY_001699 [Prymnesium sp.]